MNCKAKDDCMVAVEETLAVCQSSDRVCPQPQRWNQLYELLPGRTLVGAGWEPPLPLILGAWWDTPDMSKFSRLRVHIEWAAKEGVLDTVHAFLASLSESDWHHVGE
jgi:hypothetical protein